ncbi:hypothetical protein Kisp01_47780 [Kineosporia sp. NBRC 101677]|uniref:rhodanese-like domain-containing protein n=1 Tax=Kineosporia sp. NBRC 101677 TaxID=3032197 RepID=UPI0024A3F5CB|nr:rhodanese-like domain-containing protein [Kineosporia sp. NBRC 101677]GLY17764.1 hypothetical protein Kisp01_47780 [Kineosporia sp. NBRC 101677]
MSPLLTVEELLALRSSGSPRLLDVRWKLGGPPGPDEFRAGHIPGAVYVDLDAQLASPGSSEAGRHPLPTAAAFQQSARSWGLNSSDTVVVYDDNGLLAAARLWWLLRWAGFDGEVRLLDGGLQAWKEAGQPLATGDEPAPAEGDVTLGEGKLPTVEVDEVPEFVENGGLLLDARPAGRFSGEVASIDPRPGHIPGAVSAPATGNLGDNGRFAAPDVLRRKFGDLGVSDDRAVGVYCGSGVTAAHDLLALAVAGFDADRVPLYPGSYSQWASRPDTPVATGPTEPPLIDAAEARRRVAEGAVLLDTRSPGGREKTGPIEGAIIVDRDNLDAEFDFGSAERHAEVASLQTPIVVICGSVNGSGPVAQNLIGRGFVNVAHVEGGAPAWHELDR